MRKHNQEDFSKYMKRDIHSMRNSLADVKEEIRNRYKAEIIGIFGSYARGEEKDDSDIDVLVKFFKGASLFDFVGLADFLEEKLHGKVDVVPMDTVRDEIRERVFQEAIYL